MKKLLVHVLVNIRFYLHLTAVSFFFLSSFLFSLVTGLPFLGIDDLFGIVITFFVCELYHRMNGHKMEALLKEIRMNDMK